MSSSSSQNPDVRSLLRHILANASGVLQALQGFFKSSTPVEQTIHTNSTQNDARNERDAGQNIPNNPVRVIVERLPPPEPPEHERQAEKKRDRRPQWGLLVVNVLTLAAVVFYACVTYKMWCEMQEQTHTSHRQLEAEQRPWLSLAGLRMTGPLTFDANGANISVQYQLKNTGHSPAMQVWLESELYVESRFGLDARAERGRLCDKIVEQETPSFNIGETIFPGDDFVRQWNLQAPKASIDESRSQLGGIFALDVVACVAYRSSFSKDTYYTGLQVSLNRFDKNHPLVALGFRDTQDVPLELLRLNGTIAIVTAK
jgi:hypothetical protein